MAIFKETIYTDFVQVKEFEDMKKVQEKTDSE